MAHLKRSVVNSVELYTLQWLILWYVNFSSIKSRNAQSQVGRVTLCPATCVF